MSTQTFLVCRTTKQRVEVAASGGFGVRSSQEPKALALFCYAHRGQEVEMLSDHRLEAENLDHGELETWVDANAEARYKTLTNTEPPECGERFSAT
jgi:hypothetical protein